MSINKIIWCFTLKSGLRMGKPDKGLSDILWEKAEKSLKLLESLGDEYDEWIASSAYYSLYHAACSFLARLGIVSKNHSCVAEIMGMYDPGLGRILEKYRKIREAAQYYGSEKIDKSEAVSEVRKWLRRIEKMIATTGFDDERKKIRDMLDLAEIE